MNKTRTSSLALVLGALLAVSVSAPASAFQTMKTSGSTGDFGWLPADDMESPGARCGYSAEMEGGFARIRWIRVRPPKIVARDVSPAVDSQKASWQVVVQRRIPGNPWQKSALSARQTRTTWDNQSGSFDAIKVYINDGQILSNSEFRAVVFLRWIRNGVTEGTVKLRMEFYSVKWTVGSPDYVFQDACSGSAD